MPAINTDIDILDSYQLNSNKNKEDPNQLLQDDFLRLMTEQLKHQDPMSPTDNGEFLGQMAQFSAVSGLTDLQNSFDSLANTLQSNQTLLAATIIDKDALIPASEVQTTEAGENIKGAISLPASTGNASINVIDATGNIIQTLELGTGKQGLKDFEWNGKGSDGEDAPAGTYRFQAFFTTDSRGATEAAPTFLNSRISSVNIDEGKVTINTQDGGTHSFADLLRIG